MSFKLFKYIRIYSSLALISACSFLNTGPQPHVVYERPEFNNKVDKLVVFPTTDFQGQENKQTRIVDASVNGQWVGVYGEKNVIPGGFVIKTVANKANKKAYLKFINTLDNVSAIEQVLNSFELKRFVSLLTDKIPSKVKEKTKYHFALAIMSGGEEEYNAGNPVYLHLGLFDVEHFTWRVITKIEIKKGKSPLSKWHIDSQQAINNSFKYFETMNDSMQK